jgi:hypothetical protein
VPPTIFFQKINIKGAEHSLFPSERKAKIPQKFPNYLGKIRGKRSPRDPRCLPQVPGCGVSNFRPRNEAAGHLGRTSVERIFKHWSVAPDAARNADLAARDEWACEQILKARVPHHDVVTAFDVFAGAFAELLDALNRALRPGGRA